MHPKLRLRIRPMLLLPGLLLPGSALAAPTPPSPSQLPPMAPAVRPPSASQLPPSPLPPMAPAVRPPSARPPQAFVAPLAVPPASFGARAAAAAGRQFGAASEHHVSGHDVSARDRSFLSSHTAHVSFGEPAIQELERRSQVGALLLDEGFHGKAAPIGHDVEHIVTLFPREPMLRRAVPRVLINSSEYAQRLERAGRGNLLEGRTMIVAGRTWRDSYASALRTVREVWCDHPDLEHLPLLYDALKVGKTVHVARVAGWPDHVKALDDYLLERVRVGDLGVQEHDALLRRVIAHDP
jgi:hypothetical protein